MRLNIWSVLALLEAQFAEADIDKQEKIFKFYLKYWTEMSDRKKIMVYIQLDISTVHTNRRHKILHAEALITNLMC